MSRLPDELAEVLAAVVIADEAATADALEWLQLATGLDVYSLSKALEELTNSGWLVNSGGRVHAPSSAHARSAEARISSRRRRELHEAALARLPDPTPAQRARHLRVTGPAKMAVTATHDAAAYHFARGELTRADRLARTALERADGAQRSLTALLAARISFELGDYETAGAHAERAARSRDSDRAQTAQLLVASAKQRGGDLDGAARDLASFLERHPSDHTARGTLAKIHLLRGNYQAATDLGGTLADVERDAKGAELCVEAIGLSLLYAGARADATRAFNEIRVLAETRADSGLLGRAEALLGLAAHHRGEVAIAADHYERAAGLARAGGQIHAAASAQINRATAEADRGRFISALAALDDALVLLRRIGNIGELSAALYNRAHCLFALGDLAAAKATAMRALALAQEAGRTQFEIYSKLLLGDVARRESDFDLARRLYEAAHDLGKRASASIDMTSVELNLAELCAQEGERSAFDHLARANEASSGDNARLLLSRGRVALVLGEADEGLLEDVEPAIERAREQGREDLYWRLSALAGRLASASGARARARAHAEAASAELERTLGSIPSARHQAMRRDPDIEALTALEAELELSTLRAPLAVAGDSELRRLLALASRLNSELRLAPLLDQVIDTAIELAGAERGFLLLRAESTLEIAVARNIDRQALEDKSDARVSRSIAERAAQSGEVVLALDAAFDERFGAAESVAAMKLRSVLAVPLRFRRELIGTIYVDHRFRAGAFDERAVRLVRELANIAGVALGNARIAEESQRRAAEISELNRQLESELGDRESELAAVRAKLPPGTAPASAADEILGSSPAIRKLHELVERMAKAALPVVITGESGSGKELVARALHRLGPRRDGPFVAVNCGAVTETLLESELFGHVRGAFTGADRNRRGHFEVADGGTLFLDEIADTSPAMQTKLLRVLQEGELRRLGDEELRRVDVRVVAATNRELRELVDQGLFREDLFFRLNVLSLLVPPLRDRSGDIRELADHLLARAARGDASSTLSRTALDALSRYSWPGNVRELENELARASALCEGVIELEHLSEHIRNAVATTARDGDVIDLDLKARVEALERELIAAALETCDGNQTRAAKLLGLSRYGLQKKIKRYATDRTFASGDKVPQAP